MHKKLLILLMMILFLFPTSIQADEDIHIEITESGIQKTPTDDILLQNLVPGEQKTYTLQLENGSKKEQKIHLKLSTEENLLAEQLELRLLQNDHILYEGPVQEMQTGVELGIYCPEKKDKIKMILYLPEKADNSYTMQQVAVCIEFSAQTIKSDINTGDHTQQNLLIVGSLVSGMLLIVSIKRRWKNHEERK